MPKIMKKSIVLLIITLGFLLLTGIGVNATEIEINSIDELKETLKNESVIVNGNTVTLTGNIEAELKFVEGDYTLNLNGYEVTGTLTIAGTESKASTLTINDETGKGKVSIIVAEEYGKVIINNGNYETIANMGKVVINDGTVSTVFNTTEGDMTVNAGTFKSVSQQGTITINGGTFNSIGIENIEKTKISAGKFIPENSNSDEVVISITKANGIGSDVIQEVITENSKAVYDYSQYEVVYSYEDNGVSYFVAGYSKNIEVFKFTEEQLNLIKKIAPDGKNATLKVSKKNAEDDGFLTAVVNYMLNEDKYQAIAWAEPDDLNKVNVTIMDNDGKFYKDYVINVTYEEPESNKNIDEFISKIKEFDWEKELETSYQVTDLGLINYYLTSAKSELWNIGAPARALKFSDEVIKLTNGGAIKFTLEVRAGTQDEELMYENAIGFMGVIYNDSVYDVVEQGLYLRRVIYIPSNTADNKEAYVKAAQERINKYLGKDNLVKVEYGGKLDSLDPYALDNTIENTDGNYYNITVKGRTYKFYILKGNEEQLKETVYQGMDYDTNIKVTSTDANVPLDTIVSISTVKNEKIEKAIGTNVYAAYDISLYSDAKQAKITKLDNGKFLVSVPVPENLQDKNITVYYINSEGKTEEHIATVKDGVATFETDHFSTYVLAEKIEAEDKGEKDDTPKTGTLDIISYVLVATFISAVGIIVLKKRIS